MAQAIYTDDTQAAIARRLAATKAAAQATIARTAAPTAAGIAVNDLGSQPSTITPNEIQTRAAQLQAQAPGAGVGSDVPAYARRTPGIATGVADYSTLSPAEQAGFARQGYQPPAPAPAPAAAPTAAPTAAPVEAPGIASVAAPEVSRFRSAANAFGRFAGRAAGGVGLAYDAKDAYTDARAGDYSGAARNTGIGALDAAALTAPSPITIGASLVGHAANSAFGDGGILSGVPQYFADKINEYNGVKTPEQIKSESDAFNADRAARGLPVPVTRLPNQVVHPPADFGVESGIASTAPLAGPTSATQQLPRPASDAGGTVPIGRVVNGVRTFSDNNNVPGVPRTMDANDMKALATRAAGLTTADAGIGGGIASEAAGRTLNLGEGAPQGSNRGFTAADRQNQYDAIQERGRNADFDRLMKKSEMALSRGSRKTAAILADLATQARGPQAAAESGPGARLADARTQASIADAASTGADAKRKTATNSILDSLRDETDPNKRQDLIDTLLTSEGHPSGRVITLKVPSGQTDIAGNPVLIERPFDTRSRQYIDSPQAYGVR